MTPNRCQTLRADAVVADVAPRVLQMFRACLDDAAVQPDDRFLDAGGDSLIATMILARCEQAFGIHLPPTALFRHPTPRALAAAIVAANQEGARQGSACLVPLAPPGAGTPIFFLHAEDGSPWIYKELVDAMATTRPVYGVRAPDLDWGRDVLDLDGLVTHHLAEMRGLQAAGPYSLAGAGIGGVIAFEVACRLAADGQEVRHLIMLDSPPPQSLAGYWHARLAYAGLATLRALLGRGLVGGRFLRGLGFSSPTERLAAMFGTGSLTRDELVAVVNGELSGRLEPQRLSQLSFDELSATINRELEQVLDPACEADAPMAGDAVSVIRTWKVRVKNMWLLRKHRQTSRFPGTIVLYRGAANNGTGRWQRYAASLDERFVTLDVPAGPASHPAVLAPVNAARYAADLRRLLDGPAAMATTAGLS